MALTPNCLGTILVVKKVRPLETFKGYSFRGSVSSLSPKVKRPASVVKSVSLKSVNNIFESRGGSSIGRISYRNAA